MFILSIVAANNFTEQLDNETDRTPAICDLCPEDQTESIAEVYCLECQQHFCSNCLTFRERNRATKEHEVVGETRMSKQGRLSQRYKGDTRERQKSFGADGNSIPDYMKCKFHTNETLNHFCKEHKAVTCNTCNLIDHRNCSKTTISDIIGKSDFMKDTQDAKRDAIGLLDKFKALQTRYASYPSDMAELKDMFTKQMTDIYNIQGKQIASQLDELDTDFNTKITDAIANLTSRKTEISQFKSVVLKQTADYKKLFSMDSTALTEQSTKVSKSKLAVGKQAPHYKKNLVNEGSTAQKRVMTMILEGDIKRYCEQIDEISHNCFTVLPDRVLEKVGNFDKIVSDIYETNITVARKRPLKDKKVKLIGETSISLPDKKAKIVGLETLPDGKLLICDQTQQRIALLDIDYNNLQVHTLSTITLSSAPYGIALMSATSAFVPLPNENMIQKVKITDNKLELTSRITTIGDYIRVAKYKQNLLAIEKADEGSMISEIGQDGEIIQHITKEVVSIIQSIGFMSLNQNHDTIYVTEKKHGCIGMAMNGERVFQYKADHVQIYQGVYVDSFEHIFLAEQDNDNIVVVNKNGEMIKDFVKMKGMQPSCITFDSNGDKLLVVKGKMGKILVFELY